MTYWRYWQLTAAPFTTSAPLFRGDTVEEALARIEFLVSNRRSVGALLGASGVGKTSILRHYAGCPPLDMDSPNLQVLRMSMLGLAPNELFIDLALRLTGDRRSAELCRAWSTLSDYFQAAWRQDSHTVLLVDDAESSTTAAEADLSRLLAVTFPLTVVFAVDSQLANAVSRGLFERCELQIELPAWELSQTAEFLAWTFHNLGRKEPIFTDRAVERMQELSFGIPRRIVQLADLALVAGAVTGADCVDTDCLDQVAFELPKTWAA